MPRLILVLLGAVFFSGSTFAQNYCQWTSLEYEYGKIDYKSIFLFNSSSCIGTNCTVPLASGAILGTKDGQPTVGVPYVCNNIAQSYGKTVTSSFAALGYICTVSIAGEVLP